MSALHAATAKAVAANRELARRTADELTALAAGLRAGTPAEAVPCEPDPAVGAVLDHERELLATIAGQLEELAAEQLDGMDAFTIALFGRTGAGKSSLLEALSEGDGGSISPGDSDWTTTTRQVVWNSCRVIDSPGIQGWGRTTDRSELEEKAREALIGADIVLLCFDTQHQQAGEFRKIAEWIAEFGKPAIAVLNVRQATWRWPTRVPRSAGRARFSQSVAEHAGHIREELAAIGIHEIPLVAVHTQRAVYARAGEPIRVPASQIRSLRLQRAEVGQAVLLEWSNLPLLEQLLVAAIESGASRLRRGMLLRQQVGRLDQATQQLLTEVEQPAHRAAEQTERGIEQMLTVLGAPENYTDEPGEDADTDLAGVRAVVLRLRELEHARGGGLEAPVTGSAHRHAHNLIDARLAVVRRTTADRAERLVDEAIRDRRQVDADEFHCTVFDLAEIEQVTIGTARELTEFLQAKLGLTAQDVLADLGAVRPATATVHGAAGTDVQSTGDVLGAGLAIVAGAAGLVGVAGTAAGLAGAAGATSALGVFGVANVWNPIGWTLLVGGIAAGLAGPRIRKWLRRRGARRREEELSRARGAARKAVTDTFDGMRDDMVAWFVTGARRAVVERLGVVADQALLLRRVVGTAADNRFTLQSAADRLRQQIHSGDSADALLRDAVRSCEAGWPAARFGRSVWLGETWCDDPTGLVDSPVGPVVQPARTGRGALGDQVANRLRRVLTQAVAGPAPGAGAAWLAEVAELLAEDPYAWPMLKEIADLAADHRPRVLLYGDYNAGKSSLIKRLLVDDGQDVPLDLTIRGAPETATVDTYDWLGLQLVDTPGLQSGIAGHNALAQAQLPDAALVVHVLGASGVVGDRAGLDLVLRGDQKRGLVAKLDRTVFVVNRADELSINPFDDEDAFALIVRRKESELRAALAATSGPLPDDIEVPAERILFVAGDPGGHVGDDPDATAADFDAFRYWDGMDEVRALFEEYSCELSRNSVDVSVLHGGLARLGALAMAGRVDADRLREAMTQLDRLRNDLTEIGQAAQSIERAARASVEGIVTNAVDQLIEAALATEVELDRTTILGRAVMFWEDKEVGQAVEEWAADTRRRVEDWRRETAIRLQRRIGSFAFQHSLGSADDLEPVSFPARSGGRELIKDGSSGLGRVLSAVNQARQAQALRAGAVEAARWVGTAGAQIDSHRKLLAVTRLFMAKGEAVRIARVGVRANVALSVIVTAIDLAMIVRDRKADRRREEEFRSAMHALNQQALDWARRVADADSALAVMAEEAGEHAQTLAQLAADAEIQSHELRVRLDRLAAYDQAMERGRVALRTSALDSPAAT